MIEKGLFSCFLVGGSAPMPPRSPPIREDFTVIGTNINVWHPSNNEGDATSLQDHNDNNKKI